MNKENIPVITDREKLYDKCENMEQLFDKYYLPLLDKHYSKTYELQQENHSLKKQLHNASIQMQEMIEQDIECPSNCSKLKEILNQQKEFIDYLTSYIDLLSNKPDLIEEAEIDILEEILSKYKEIIGGKEWKIY